MAGLLIVYGLMGRLILCDSPIAALEGAKGVCRHSVDAQQRAMGVACL